MLRLTLKNVWGYKVRLALTATAVVLGVAFMVGTMVLTDTMSRSFDSIFETAGADIDLVIQRSEAVSYRDTTARARISESTVGDVRAVSGVDSASGAIQGMTQIVYRDGTFSPQAGTGMSVGGNWIEDARLNPFELASGHAPQADDEVVIDKATAEAQGFQAGDSLKILVRGEPVALTVAGIATFGDLDGIPGTSLVALNDRMAQQYFAEPGQYDSIVVAAGSGVELGAVSADINSALGAGSYEIKTGAQDTADKQEDLKEDLSFFNDFLMTFAYVALFVGTFIIYNTFSILIAQRAKDNAMLRAIGASRRQLLWSTAIESAVVGLVAGAIGLGLGILMSFGLRALLTGVGMELPSAATVVGTHTVVTAFVVGVGVTVLSAVGPAMKGSRVRPIAALRDVAIDRTGASIIRTVIGTLMAAAGVGAFANGVIGKGESALMFIAMGSLATVLGLFVLGPVLAGPIVRVIAWPIAARGGATGSLARENATRSPKRTAATASALMVGVALVGFITVLAASTKASIDDAIGKSMGADFVIDTGNGHAGGLNTDLAARLAARPEVKSLSAYRSAPGELEGAAVMVDSVDTATVGDVFDLNVLEGSIEDVGAGSIAVVVDQATERGLELGDTVHVRFTGGETDLRVVAIYDAMFPEGGFLVDNSTVAAYVPVQLDKKIFLSMADGVEAGQARALIEQELGGYPSADLQDKAEFTENITSQVDALLNLVYGLLTLAVVIALIGIANTLALSVHERTREIGLLRAVGMTQGQVRCTVRIESVLIALLGTVLGTVLAIASAWGITKALEPDVSAFIVPGAQLAVIICLAAGAGILAALAPARRASKLNVLDAISTS